MAQNTCRRRFNQQGRLTAKIRMPTRSVRTFMALRCSDPGSKRRSSHTSLPMSDFIGRGEPPGLLSCGYCLFDRHPGSWPSKKPIKIGIEECCLKIGAKKCLKKFWCSYFFLEILLINAIDLIFYANRLFFCECPAELFRPVTPPSIYWCRILAGRNPWLKSEPGPPYPSA